MMAHTFDIDCIDRSFPGWSDWLRKHTTECTVSEADAGPSKSNIEVVIGNFAKPQQDDLDGNKSHHEWTCYVRPVLAEDVLEIASVTFYLDPTFNPHEVTVKACDDSNSFSISRKGWGIFDIGIEIKNIDGGTHRFVHSLSFDSEGKEATMQLPSVCSTRSPMAQRKQHPVMNGVPEALMHGIEGVGSGWNPPIVTLASDEEARPGYDSMKAEEYHDDPETLQKKITVLADLIRKSQHFVTYTGAGISTSSGIGDYASKGRKSAANAVIAKAGKVSHLDASPTLAHFTLAALHREGYLKHWVQQNHDGLPQKAGYPQHALNEIHGAWFDPSNPVVPMAGSLRDDLCDWMCQEEKDADLVLAMGTSLCGMNADRMVETPGGKRIRHKIGFGAVIVGFQRTRLDKVASLRIFASIDEVMLLLARELTLAVNPAQFAPSTPPADYTFDVPYNKDGEPCQGGKMQLCLAAGTKVKLTGGPGKGFVGKVTRTPTTARRSGQQSYRYAHQYAYEMEFPCTREGSKHFGKGKRTYALGAWMIDEAVRGKLHVLPIVNA